MALRLGCSTKCATMEIPYFKYHVKLNPLNLSKADTSANPVQSTLSKESALQNKNLEAINGPHSLTKQLKFFSTLILSDLIECAYLSLRLSFFFMLDRVFQYFEPSGMSYIMLMCFELMLGVSAVQKVARFLFPSLGKYIKHNLWLGKKSYQDNKFLLRTKQDMRTNKEDSPLEPKIQRDLD